MSVSLQALAEQIESAKGVKSVVETMRAMSLVNIRRAEQAAAVSAQYLRCIHLAIYVALRASRRLDNRAGRRVSAPSTYLILSSNQGLCGQFNERIVAYTNALINARSEADEPTLISVGYRGAERLRAVGRHIAASLDAPNSVEAIGTTVRQIFILLSERLDARQRGRMIVVHNTPVGGNSYDATHFQLAPLDARRWSQLPEGEPPFATVPQAPGELDRLVQKLTHELLYIDVYRALTDSFAAENAARLTSMQGAVDNLEERLGELESRHREMRQEAVTNELMDIVTGIAAAEDPS